MLSVIIWKEILEYLLTFRFPLFFIICAALIPTSLYVNSIDYSSRVGDVNEQTRLADESLRGHSAYQIQSGQVSLKGFRRPSPLSVFATGFELSLPRFYEFSPDGPRAGEASFGEESIVSSFGRFDYLFIVQMVMSLMALLLAADLVAGEKELGTLRGILSNGVPRYTVLAGKLIGGFIVVWVPFLVASLAGIILLRTGGFSLLDAGVVTRVTAVFTAASLFILVYFTLGLMVSASVARVRTSLVAILLVWILLQLIIPRISDMTASAVYPVRTGTVFSMQKSLVVESLEKEKSLILGRRFVAIFGPHHPLTTNPPPSPENEEWNAYKASVDRDYHEREASRLRQIEDAYAKQKETQRSIAESLSLLSPGGAFTRLVTDLCGTGEIERGKYRSAVDNHQAMLDAELYGHLVRTSLTFPEGGSVSASSSDRDIEAGSLPSFSIRSAGLSEVITGNIGSLVSLAIWLFASFGLAYVRFLKYDVR